MNDSEFIELLNLYLDHEITAADAARLEAEVRNNPKRRQVYNQYCRMQKGCKLLASDFQTEAVTADAPQRERKVIDFAAASRASRGSGFYTMGAVAAVAACVAIVLIGRNREVAPDAGVNGQTVATVSKPTPAPTTTQVANATMVRETADAKTAVAASKPRGAVLTGHLSLADEVQVAAATAHADTQFAWIQTFQLAPLPQAGSAVQQELKLEARPASLHQTGPRIQGQGTANEAATETVAYRFTR